jgi:BASS family bile acid:Na+ symporter
MHHYAPEVTAKISKPVSTAALAVLVVCALVVLFKLLPAMISLIGDGTIVVFIVFVAVGIIAGHLLGGPQENNRVVLAHSSAVRHPAVALAIASANFPEQKLVIPAILLYLLVNLLVFIPYLAWRRRNQDKKGGAHHGSIQPR